MRHKRRAAVIMVAAVIMAALAVILTAGVLARGEAAGPQTKRIIVDREGTTAGRHGASLTTTALDPAEFSPGACTEFTPGGSARRGQTVFIDAGHGGIDPGGTGQASSGVTVSESSVNLDVAIDAMKILTSAGYRVVLSRTQQTTVLRLGPGDTDGGLLTVQGVGNEIAARDACADDAHASLLVGLYMNAGGAGEAGSVTLYDAVRPFSADSRRFAGLLQQDVRAKLNAAGYGIPDDGIHDDVGYGSTISSASVAYGHLELLGPAYPQNGFTTPSQMPGALIEPLFLTDPFEASIAASTHGQQLIAEGLANAIEGYFHPQYHFKARE